MKTRISAMIALFSLGLLTTAQAEESPLYGGLKVGAMLADKMSLDDGVRMSNPDAVANAGIIGGYQLNIGKLGFLGAEGELTTSFGRGRADFSRNGAKIPQGDNVWGVTTAALYGAYQSPGKFYAKARAGILYNRISASGNTLSASATDWHGSYSLGGGWKIGEGALELEYTMIEKNIDFVSLGYRFQIGN